MEEVLVPIGFFAFVFGIVWLVVDKNIKKMLIQHGADAKTLKMDKDSNGALKFGLLLVGVALGIIIGNFVAAATSMQEETAYVSMTFLFGGIALLIYHFIIKGKAKSGQDY
jgi:hypothetical protein